MLKDFLASYPTEEKEEIPKRLSLLLLLLAKKKKRKFSFSRLGLEGGGSLLLQRRGEPFRWIYLIYVSFIIVR